MRSSTSWALRWYILTYMQYSWIGFIKMFKERTEDFHSCQFCSAYPEITWYPSSSSPASSPTASLLLPRYNPIWLTGLSALTHSLLASPLPPTPSPTPPNSRNDISLKEYWTDAGRRNMWICNWWICVLCENDIAMVDIKKKCEWVERKKLLAASFTSCFPFPPLPPPPPPPPPQKKKKKKKKKERE